MIQVVIQRKRTGWDGHDGKNWNDLPDYVGDSWVKPGLLTDYLN